MPRRLQTEYLRDAGPTLHFNRLTLSIGVLNMMHIDAPKFERSYFLVHKEKRVANCVWYKYSPRIKEWTHTHDEKSRLLQAGIGVVEPKLIEPGTPEFLLWTLRVLKKALATNKMTVPLQRNRNIIHFDAYIFSASTSFITRFLYGCDCGSAFAHYFAGGVPDVRHVQNQDGSGIHRASLHVSTLRGRKT